MSDQPTAVLLMAYGTPRSRDEILPYYTDIRRGRPPTADQLADLTRRYDAIGGLSPLAERTEAQRVALQTALDARAPGQFAVALGFKHAPPLIEAAVDAVATNGFPRLVALVLAPHYSRGSIGDYMDRARAVADKSGIEFSAIESWAVEPAFIDFLADDLAARLQKAPTATRVVFTAHSLPARVIAGGDRYPDELRATAEAVAARTGLADKDWVIAWQSAGRTPEPWIGPDILDVIAELGANGSAKGVIVCACGFVADHLEVLFDIDIQARRAAEQCGFSFDRTACVNADPAVMAALAARVIAATETT
jgi:protoporphyrin/coproporphyrin ferrochelatase